MTVSTTAYATTISGNGATTVFSFAFIADNSSTIKVTLTDVNGVQTVLNPSQYTLFINSPAVGSLWGIGGTITYPLSGSPIASGTSLTIERTVPYTQGISISNQGAFYPQAVEQGLDLLELQIQQFQGQLTNAVRAPVVDGILDMTLPAIAARANKFLYFDLSGLPALSSGVPSTTPIGAGSKLFFLSGYASLALADAAAAAASGELVIDTNVTLTGNITLSSKVIQFAGGVITRGSNNLTISGSILAGAVQIFSSAGAGTISIGSGQVNMAWFGTNLQFGLNAASGKSLIWPAGSYTTTGLNGVSNINIIFDGPVNLSITANAVALDFSNKVGVTMTGGLFTITGTGPTYSGFPSAGITDSGQGGLKFVDSKNINIDADILITNILGSGFESTKPSHAFTNEFTNTFRDVTAKSCYRGLYIHNFSEYDSYMGCSATQCIYGLALDSGNNTISDCQFVYNNSNLLMTGGTNDGHNAIVNCIFNHGTFNAGFLNIVGGQHFTGCQFLSDQSGSGHGIITVINSIGISFVGGGMGSDISVDATSQVSCQSNFIRTTLCNPPVVTAGGSYWGSGNFTITGLFYGGWNSFASWTPVLKFGGGTTGITYSEQNGRYNISNGFLEFSGQITLTSKGSSTGVATITGLPLAAANIDITLTPLTIRSNNATAAVTDITAFVAANTTTISLYNFATGSCTTIDDTVFNNNTTLWYSGKYPLG